MLARLRIPVVAAVGAGALLGTGWLGAGPAAGQDDCDAVVVDETGQLDVDAVAEAADALVDRATVRVRFWESTDGGDVDGAVEQLTATCWSGPEGRRLDDLVLLVVSVGDRTTSLTWGEAVDRDLDPVDGDIRDGVINPNLADGDFTAAAVQGLAEIDAALDGVDDAPTGGADDGAGDDGAAGGDGDGPPVTALAAVGLLAVAGAGGAAALRRRQLNERRRALDEAIEEPLGRAGDLRERGRQLELRSSTTDQVLAGAAQVHLDDVRARARDAGHAVDAATVLLRQATPEGVAEAGNDQLELAEDRVVELAAAVAAHDAALSALDRAVRRFDRLRVTLPTKRELLLDELDDTDALAAQRRDEGWRTDELEATLAVVRAGLEALDLSPLRWDVDTLSARVEAAEADLFATRHALQSLPARRDGLESWAEQLAGSVALQRERVGAAAAELRRLATIHDPASLASLADNPAQAAAALDRAELARLEAMAEPFTRQDWDEVGRRLEEAGLHLLRADAELDEIDQASVELADAQARAAEVLARAEDALADVQRFVEDHDDDLGPRFDTEPAAVQPVLAGLAVELRRSRPNYLRVLQTAEQTTADLDRLMAEAHDEQARVAALRRQAQQEEAWAVAAVSRARQALGWQLFATGEATDLDDLEARLGALPDDLAERVMAARAITVEAQQIEARVVNRRRRGSVWIVGGSMGGGWGGGGSGGSSGGGGFGGGSFGGGGFGGGGFGGGGFGGGGGGSSSW